MKHINITGVIILISMGCGLYGLAYLIDITLRHTLVQIMESMKVENVVKFRHEAIELLKRLDSRDRSVLDVYFIFNREEAKIVYTFLKAFYTLTRQEISISFWDKTKEKVAFVKRQNCVLPAIPTSNISLLKEHSDELEALFSGNLDKSLPFFNAAREYGVEFYTSAAA